MRVSVRRHLVRSPMEDVREIYCERRANCRSNEEVAAGFSPVIYFSASTVAQLGDRNMLYRLSNDLSEFAPLSFSDFTRLRKREKHWRGILANINCGCTLRERVALRLCPRAKLPVRKGSPMEVAG